MANGVVREGFLCPICLQDLGDISQLRVHVSDAHRDGQDDKDVVNHLKDFLGKAKQRLLNFDPAAAWSENFPSAEHFLTTASSTSAVISEFERELEPQEPGYCHACRNCNFNSARCPLAIECVCGACCAVLGKKRVKTSHTDYFRRIRDARIDQFAVDTNKLIIRLDKLISDTPTDPSKRKAFEKNVIPWINDSDVHFCSFCGGRFSITKRKHHCRLCGKIMCSLCSQFLTFLAARKLINPAGYEPEHELVVGKTQQHQLSGGCSSSGSGGGSPARKAEKLLSATLSILKRDGSEVSFGSLLSQEGEDQLRICRECKELLNRRDEQMEQRSQPPHVVQMYERLRSLMNEAGKVFPSYCRMAESLNCGESMYSLEAAKELKLKVLRLQEQIDFVSKKIMHFGVQEAAGGSPAASGGRKTGPSPRELLLQRNVRSFAGAFLQEMILSVPNLPSEEEYGHLQKQYKKKLTEQIEAERLAAQMAAQRMISLPEDKVDVERRKLISALSAPSGSEAEEGWTPDTSAIGPVFHYNPFDEDQPIDPLQQQILIIKGYLKQAAESGRLEEVRMLEQNLRELEAELKEQNVATSPR